jgi:hypothetical protein
MTNVFMPDLRFESVVYAWCMVFDHVSFEVGFGKKEEKDDATRPTSERCLGVPFMVTLR